MPLIPSIFCVLRICQHNIPDIDQCAAGHTSDSGRGWRSEDQIADGDARCQTEHRLVVDVHIGAADTRASDKPYILYVYNL